MRAGERQARRQQQCYALPFCWYMVAANTCPQLLQLNSLPSRTQFPLTQQLALPQQPSMLHPPLYLVHGRRQHLPATNISTPSPCAACFLCPSAFPASTTPRPALYLVYGRRQHLSATIVHQRLPLPQRVSCDPSAFPASTKARPAPYLVHGRRQELFIVNDTVAVQVHTVQQVLCNRQQQPAG